MARRTGNVFALLLQSFERILDGPRPRRRLLTVLAGALASWWIFVPLHELLHAAGCLLGGGQVTRLEIAPLYGGAFWARIFPFVYSGGGYAGRLSGFDTGGDGATYALTILAPYVLCPLGFLLLGRAVVRRSPLLFGLAAPWAFSPLLAVTGDFLELGGLLLFQFWPGPSGVHRTLISDDLFRIAGQLAGSSEASPSPESATSFVAASQALGLILACLCWIASSRATKLSPGSRGS